MAATMIGKRSQKRGSLLVLGTAIAATVAVTAAVTSLIVSRPSTAADEEATVETAAAAASSAAASEGERSPSSRRGEASRLAAENMQGLLGRVAYKEKSQAILADLNKRVLNLNLPSEGSGPEMAANVMTPFLEGMMTSVRAMNPEMVGYLREEFAKDLCSRTQSIDQVMVFSRLVVIEPQLGSRDAFNCLLKTHGKEDVVLWSILDAWNVTGRPAVEGIAHLQSATDERTRRRLQPPEAQVRDRLNVARHIEAGAR
jgi:hypothetical protein